jgi:hypothetical protein
MGLENYLWLFHFLCLFFSSPLFRLYTQILDSPAWIVYREHALPLPNTGVYSLNLAAILILYSGRLLHLVLNPSGA